MRYHRQSSHTTESDSSVEKEFSPLPEVVQSRFLDDQVDNGHAAYPEKEVAQAEKEVGASDEKEGVEDFTYGLPLQGPDIQSELHQNGLESRGCMPVLARRPSKKAWIVCVGFFVLLALGIGLVVGLSLGLQRQTPPSSAQHSASTTNSMHDSLTLSTRGAFNGTSIAITKDRNGQNLTSSAPGSFNKWNLLLVYQHYNGELRWMQRIYLSSTWVGGSAYDVVATDAKNASAIGVDFKEADGIAYHHVFYIDKNNRARQRIINNMTLMWADGPLNDLNIQAVGSGHAGLLSCYYSGSVSNTDLAAASSNDGIQLWVATDETTFGMWAWEPGLPWVFQQSVPGLNGHVNPGCYSWGTSNTTYMMFLDLYNSINVYWRDTYGVTDNTSRPINQWTNSSINIPGIDPTSSISYSGNLIGKMAGSNVIANWNVSFAIENTSIAPNAFPNFEDAPSVYGSDITSWSNPAGSTANQVAIFYQIEGDDITMYSASSDSGTWTQSILPIPDD